MTNDEIVDLLFDQILFNDVEIVALNKPYGISIHANGSVDNDDDENKNRTTTNSTSQQKKCIALNQFLPNLAKKLGVKKLYTVHRLDRDTTGVLLLASTQSKAHHLSTLFREHRIEKRYLCITKNNPNMSKGIIDIPIENGYVNSTIKDKYNKKRIKRERMVLCPEPMESIRNGRARHQSRNARRAVTRFRVLSEEGNAALIEVYPETGIKNQIRVHLGFGLRCPILGDNKYSNLDSLKPQRLPSDILLRLGIRQQKARYVPMHLHAYLYNIPNAGKTGSTINIRAPLPYHFRHNMRSLKLRLD